MSELNPILLTKEEKEKIDSLEAMNRKDRRALGKQLKAKIPGSNRPYTKHGNHTPKETS